ncbi:MAG: hypothetical protein FD166_1852 [Bacteroidetes bacterium]|nr:MAG: hypothetical protein FD166_1852 [Bacteroidota bacterium]
MSRAHKLYIFLLSSIVIATLVFLIFKGISFYRVSLEERFFHPDYKALKPSGIWGHGLGIIGSFLMLVGVFIYLARKRMRSLSRLGVLKHWLEFHIFLCTLGPILVLFHTSFKFGGIVAISFWSMVAVFLSGIIGRFIYIQIPRSIEGRELTLNEVRDLKQNLSEILSTSYKLDEMSYNLIIESTRRKAELLEGYALWKHTKNYFSDQKMINKIRVLLRKNGLSKIEVRQVTILVRNELALNRKIDRLLYMQNLFKYWHVAHLPFAIIMLIIMIIHVGVTITFGYRWVF